MKKYALISTFDKSNLKIICEFFSKKNIGIISTGGTAKYIKNLGYKASTIKDMTGFEEILGGRVKSMHPHIYASLLYNEEKQYQVKEFEGLNFPNIEFLIVNLYPFQKSIKKNLNYKKCIEMIDIGGPTLLRAASKNYQRITAICDPQDYSKLILNWESNNNKTSLEFRKQMSIKSFKTTCEFDREIFTWLEDKKINNNFTVLNHNKIKLKYGENSHQEAIFYKKNKKNFYNNQLHGKELGFNNLRDIDSAFNCISEFKDPTSVIIKHNSPCGAASSKNIFIALKNSLNADLTSSFGGIIALNRTVDKKTALLISKNFYEAVLAPKFNSEAVKILKKKNSIRLIVTAGIKNNQNKEVFSINNGYLIQEPNRVKINRKNIKLVSDKKCSNRDIDDLIFAFKICKHVKSNAIVLASNLKTIAIGGGQSSRIESTKIAVNKAKKNINFVAASDAFFPFTDCIKMLVKKKCKAVIQPSGSINDKKVIQYANDKNLPLYFSVYRLFKH